MFIKKCLIKKVHYKKILIKNHYKKIHYTKRLRKNMLREVIIDRLPRRSYVTCIALHMISTYYTCYNTKSTLFLILSLQEVRKMKLNEKSKSI